MPDLFRESEERAIAAAAPLAVRMRPATIDDILGQEHFLGPGKMLRRMLEADRLSSLVFHGPPGSGKTTLANVIAASIDCDFHMLNAASASVKDVREVIEHARKTLAATGRRTVLFLDELHRFNRAQQDVLLNDVEMGTIILIGATTENPFFTINSPLLSRSTIFKFEPLTEGDIVRLLRRALSDEQRGLGGYDVQATDEALEHLAKTSDGDARRALTALEVGVLSQAKGRQKRKDFSAENAEPAEKGLPGEQADISRQRGQEQAKGGQAGRSKKRKNHSAENAEPAEKQGGQAIVFDLAVAQESIQQKAIQYDRAGDMHYDAASAFIKSMRGSDPDAAVYWLARMLAAGEDPRFVARRIAILASEDIGNADPRAISVAAAAFDIAERIGMPECRITLAQATVYMACAPKSNASYRAISAAMEDVEQNRTVPVPRHLRNAPHPAMAERYGYSKGYQYSHDFEGGISPDQEYLGVDKKYYFPTQRGYEKHMAEYLKWAEALRQEGREQTQGQESP